MTRDDLQVPNPLSFLPVSLKPHQINRQAFWQKSVFTVQIFEVSSQISLPLLPSRHFLISSTIKSGWDPPLSTTWGLLWRTKHENRSGKGLCKPQAEGVAVPAMPSTWRFDICRKFQGSAVQNSYKFQVRIYKMNLIELRFTLKSVCWKNIEMPLLQNLLLDFSIPNKVWNSELDGPLGDMLQTALRRLWKVMLL